MSEPGPESIPTSADPRSRRPAKRRAVSPRSQHATQVESLFRDPNKELKLPDASHHKSATLMPPPPEIVANVQGSSAGAGSGEFHVYKASRRREYERLRLMQDEVDREKSEAEWRRDREQTRRKDEEKTERNRRKRDKRRAAKKGNAGDAKADGMVVDSEGPPKKGPEQGPNGADGEHAGPALGHDQVDETPGVVIHDE